MSEDRSTEILKSAILLERRGQAFYSKVAEQAKDEAVRRFFSLMAEEEVAHVRILSDHFKAYRKDHRFKAADASPDSGFEAASRVLTEDLKRQISAADFEAAAIASAMAMEKNAIQLYSRRAAETRDPEEKKLYEWLAKWEAEHLEFLSRLDRELTESIWNDQGFWPF
jgi:rubrerythrin